MHRALLAVTFTFAPLLAQATPVVAFPQDATFLTVSSATPFGLFVFAPFPEARYQLLIPAERLPTRPTLIRGLAAVSRPNGGTIHYTRLQIALGHTDLSALGTEFAANLPSPQVVWQRSGPVVWNGADWTTLTFDVPFAYDGRSGLVIEVQKEVASSSGGAIGTAVTGSSQTPPNGLPNARWTSGATGSGASRATTATSTGKPIQVRLLVDAPTLTVRSEGALQPRFFAQGSTVELAAYGPAGSCYCAAIDVAFRAPYELPGLAGRGRILPMAEFALRDIPAGGRDVFPFVLPVNPSLSGTWFMLQAGFVFPDQSLSWSCPTAFQIDSQ